MPRHAPAPARRGIVLLAVLIVVVILSLAAYHYAELAFSEYKAADQSLRHVQALALADSGVHHAMALLSNSDGLSTTLGGNPYHNPQVFSDVAVHVDPKSGYSGKYTLLAPPDPQANGGDILNGVIDESGKINLNSLILWDLTLNAQGAFAMSMLQALPNMTSDIAAAIVDYIDPDDTALTGGAESSYYSGLNPPYACKNGPLDSLEELLVVKGVTPELLFGQDRNPYGLPKRNAIAPGDRGWSAFLTVVSREQNIDLSGNPMVYLNDSNLQNLAANLATLGVDDSTANFIILARLYKTTPVVATAATASSGSSSTTGSMSGNASSPSSATQTANPSNASIDLTQTPTQKINSLFDLINVTITQPATMSNTTTASGGTGGGTTGGDNDADDKTSKSTSSKSTSSKSNAAATSPTVYASPFNNQSTLATMFPILWNGTTTSQNSDNIPRININTAPVEVLQALATIQPASAYAQPSSSGSSSSTTSSSSSTTSGSSSTSSSGTSGSTATASSYLQDTDIQNILSFRPTLSELGSAAGDYSSPLWLYTQANIQPTFLSKLDQYITTKSQVYRVHVQGTLDGKAGSSARVEALIDTNGGQPRILSWRNLSELGKASVNQGGGQQNK